MDWNTAPVILLDNGAPHRGERLVLASEAESRIAELEAQLAVEREKLAVGEALAEHFDNCVDCWDCLGECNPVLADAINCQPDTAGEKADG